MPIYNFKCNHCTSNFLSLQNINEEPDQCPECLESKGFEKLVSAPVIRTAGKKSMSVKHTTSEYFGPHGPIKKEEYFPEEVKRKTEEERKKRDGKGSSIIV